MNKDLFELLILVAFEYGDHLFLYNDNFIIVIVQKEDPIIKNNFKCIIE